jgi:hypothetical protein
MQASPRDRAGLRVSAGTQGPDDVVPAPGTARDPKAWDRHSCGAGHGDRSVGGTIWDFGGEPNLGFDFGGCDLARTVASDDGGGSLASSACPPGSSPQPLQTPKANATPQKANAIFLDRMALSLCDPGWNDTTREAIDPR